MGIPADFETGKMLGMLADHGGGQVGPAIFNKTGGLKNDIVLPGVAHQLVYQRAGNFMSAVGYIYFNTADVTGDGGVQAGMASAGIITHHSNASNNSVQHGQINSITLMHTGQMGQAAEGIAGRGVALHGFGQPAQIGLKDCKR